MLKKEIIKKIINENKIEFVIIGTKLDVNLGLNGTVQYCFKFKRTYSIQFGGRRRIDLQSYRILDITDDYIKIESFNDVHITNPGEHHILNKKISYIPLEEVQYIQIVNEIEEVEK